MRVFFFYLISALILFGASCASRYAQVNQHIRQEQYDLAEHALKVDGPHDAEGWALLASCYFYQKDYPQLADAAKNSLGISQTYRARISYFLQEGLIAQLQDANKLLQSGNEAEAIAAYNQILVFSEAIDHPMKNDIDEIRERIKSVVAATSLKLRDYPQAKNQLESMEGWKDSPELTERLAQTYYHMGEWDNCIAACERVLEGSPRNVTVLTLRAQALAESGRTASAIASLREALKLSPENLSLERDAGILCYRMGEWREARGHLEKVMKVDSRSRDALRIIVAECCYSDGDYKTALDYYKQALTANPDDANILRATGACYWSLGDYTAANAAFSAARKLEKADSLSAAEPESRR